MTAAASWTTPEDLKAQLLRLWERGELLREGLDGRSRFPLRLNLRKPSSVDVTERFGAVRAWAASLAGAPPLRVEWLEVRHRVQGLQRLPASVWIDTLDDALCWIGRLRDQQRFLEMRDTTGRQCPALLPWLERRPLKALDLRSDWPRLLAVVDWVVHHPRPGIYLRQVDLPGVHSKFIETHLGVLSELLELALPADDIDTHWNGTSRFAARYGFLQKPVRIRLRVLDPALRVLEGVTCPDLTLDAASFGRLRLGTPHVVITENEINFLALPALPGTIAIFGAGYGWDALAQAAWLHRCAIHYWGDIDTHGFAILDQLRAYFPHVSSVLMDRATLDAHEAFWGHEASQHAGDLHRLTLDERGLYDVLRDNRIREGLRLEQEHLGFGWVTTALEQALARPFGQPEGPRKR